MVMLTAGIGNFVALVGHIHVLWGTSVRFYLPGPLLIFIGGAGFSRLVPVPL